MPTTIIGAQALKNEQQKAAGTGSAAKYAQNTLKNATYVPTSGAGAGVAVPAYQKATVDTTGMNNNQILALGQGPLKAGSTATISAPKVTGNATVSPAASSYYGGGTQSGGSGYATYQKGVNTDLDAQLAPLSQKYMEARAAGDYNTMAQVNAQANQLRNQAGFAAVSAADDINLIRSQQRYVVGPEYAPSQQQFVQAPSEVMVPQVQQTEDFSSYIAALKAAADEQAKAELKAAYDKNVNAIDAAQGQIAPQYQAARNQVAGQAALANRNWQEQASAMGLSSGAAGQAALANSVALHGNLSDLSRSESSDLAQLQLQRTQTETEYNNAIAKAKADGNYQLAQQLYQEAVRVDEANRAAIATAFQQQLQAIQVNHNMAQDALSQQNWETSRGDTLAQQAWSNKYQEDQAAQSQQNTNFNNLLNLISSYAQSTGDYSLFSQMGFTPEQISAWGAAWQQDKALADAQVQAAIAQKLKTGSGGTSKSSGSSSSGSKMTLSAAQNMAKQRQFTQQVIDTLRNAGYTDEYIKSVYKWTGHITGTAITDPSELGPAAMLIYKKWQAISPSTTRNVKADFEKLVRDGYTDGSISEDEGKYILSLFGYNG